MPIHLDLPSRLHFAENDLLSALEGGTTILASYYQTWSALPGILHTAWKTGSIDHETLSLTHSVASRIENLASCFLDIKRGEESYMTSLRRDCDAILHQMVSLNLNANLRSLQLDSGADTCCACSYSSPPVSSVEGLSPPFLATVHQWLLDNLHNPYPTAEVKARMATTSSCKISSINSWFTSARRRIGWTTLCRDHFSNCRADMLDAAYRALVQEDSLRTLSPELRNSFVAMRVAAEGLCSAAPTRSTFAGGLSAISKGVTKEDSESVRIGECNKVDNAHFMKVQETERRGSFVTENLQAVQDLYPSPDPSTTTSPVPALCDSFTDESKDEGVAPPTMAGSKRCWSSIEPVDRLSSATARPIKRLRASATPRTCLPSPPSSTYGVNIPSSDGSPESPYVHLPQVETNEVAPRKRCLSDADAAETPKCLSDSEAAPCLYTASDPLPHTSTENEYSINYWLNTDFDALFAIPPPVDATEPDVSASWEVEVFKDYSIPGNLKHALKCLPLTVDNAISAPSDLSDLDSLLRSIGSDIFTTPSSNVLLSEMTAPSMASLDSSIPNIWQTNTDWTSLLNGTETYQPITFPQYPTDLQPLPDIDLTMLQLPPVAPVDSQGDFVLKQAKLHQLHTMKEAVRKMEQKLRAEGVVL